MTASPIGSSVSSHSYDDLFGDMMEGVMGVAVQALSLNRRQKSSSLCQYESLFHYMMESVVVALVTLFLDTRQKGSRIRLSRDDCPFAVAVRVVK